MIEPEAEYEEHWHGRFWGVYSNDNHECDPPLALFADREHAEEWLSRMVYWGELPSDCHCVLRTDLEASYWNGPEGEDPRHAAGKEAT